MNNFILGSGVIGRVALDIYQGYNIIPFGKSRFYSFYPSLGEEYIISNPVCDEYIRKYSGSIIVTNHEYRRSVSNNGLIINNPNQDTIDEYINKVHQCESKLMSLLFKNLNLNVYNITVSDIYNKLQTLNSKLVESNVKFGKLTKIDTHNHTLHTSTGTYGYDNIISTIPLNILQQLCGVKPVTGRQVVIYDILTDDLDFEGNDELFVADANIDFYLVRKIDNGRYLFFSLNDIQYAEQYFSLYFKNFKILAKVAIDDYIPVGDIPAINIENITCVGSYAKWDYFYDVSTSISKLLKMNI